MLTRVERSSYVLLHVVGRCLVNLHQDCSGNALPDTREPLSEVAGTTSVFYDALSA